MPLILHLSIFPKVIEDIIKDYVHQLILAEKIKKVNAQIKEMYYVYINSYFAWVIRGDTTYYYYYSEYFDRLISVRSKRNENMWNENTILAINDII